MFWQVPRFLPIFFFVDLFKNMSSDDSLFFDSDEEEREWETLLGKEHVTALIDWLALKCPGCLALHECALEKGAWETCKGTPEEKVQEFEAKCKASMESLYQTFLQTFGGTPLLERFLRIERREDEDDAMDVLEDFWADHREPWMHVANEDARARLKTIRVGTEVLVMAEIHRKIALSNINLTGVASRILKVPNPCVYAVSRMLDNVTGPSDDDAMMWNLPAANDVLDHLISCQARD